MPEIATVYERYSDFDETNVRKRRPVTVMRLFDQQELPPEVHQPWRPKYALRYVLDENEKDKHLGLAGGMEKYASVPEGTESGVTVTYPLETIPSSTGFELEQEIELYVKMPPKSVRRVTVKITARKRGIPNPIL
jgi:hypothetical protein